MSGSAAASPRPGAGPLDVATPAGRAEVEQALATAPAQTAIRTWGPVSREQVLQLSGGGPPVLVLAHPRRGILTFVDNSPGALRSGNPTAISLGPTAEHGLRYYTVTGVPVADLTVSGDRVTVSLANANGPDLKEFYSKVLTGPYKWTAAGSCFEKDANKACVDASSGTAIITVTAK